MVFTSSRSFKSLVLGVLLAFSHVLDASNLEEKLPPEGQLGVRLDYELATMSKDQIDANHQWMFSSHLTFKEEVKSITDGQLTKIAIDAYKEMEADFPQYNIARPRKLLPGVMIIMAFGKEIILVSSQKGLGALIERYPESPVSLDLQRCMIERGSEHAHQGKCGEPMAFHLYYRTHPEEPLSELTDQARVSTIRKDRNGDYVEMVPCGTGRDVS